MKRKELLYKFAIMASIMGMTMLLTPKVYYAEANATVQQGEAQKKKTDYEYNKEAIDFLNYVDKAKLKTWDNSLATMTEEEANEIKAYMEENIIKGETNDYKNAKSIFNWICQNVKYGNNPSQKIGLDPYDVFKLKYAVCGGYSNLYKAMLNLADIPSVVVTGNTKYGPHAWNLVYAGGKWFYSDSTWGGRYFDLNAEVSAKDHTPYKLEGATIDGGDGLTLGYYKGVSVFGLKEGNTSLKVPENYKDLYITSVYTEVFQKNTSIEHLYLSKNVTEIDTKISAKKLKHIEVSENNSKFASKDGVLYTKDFSEVLIYPEAKDSETLTLQKETTKYDSKETFTNKYLKIINVEKGNSSFSSYDGAVYNKNETQLITIPNGKNSITVLGSVKLDNTALSFKENLKKVILNEGITEIPDYTFNGSSNLKEIHIPKTITKIGSYAFQGVKLANVTIYGEKGSYAEEYANSKKIKFVGVTPKINIADINDINRLKELIDKADKIDSNLYTEASMIVLKNSIVSAKEILAKSEASKKEVESAATNLENAIKVLKVREKVEENKAEKEVVIENKIVADKADSNDIAGLKQLIDKADKTDSSLYTEDTMLVLKNSIVSAKEVVAKSDVLKAEVEKARTNLHNAINGLKKV